VNTGSPIAEISEHKVAATEREVFALLLNYKDPFISERSIQSRKTNSSILPKPKSVTTRNKTNVSKKTPKKKVKFPEIEYKGNVKMVSGQEKAIVKMNNNIHHWRSGERKDELLLERIYDDSIQVRFQDMVEVFPKDE